MRTQKFGLFSPYQKFGAIQAMHNLPYFQQKLLQKPKRLFLESSRVGNQTTEHRKVRLIESLRPKPRFGIKSRNLESCQVMSTYRSLNNFGKTKVRKCQQNPGGIIKN